MWFLGCSKIRLQLGVPWALIGELRMLRWITIITINLTDGKVSLWLWKSVENSWNFFFYFMAIL